jgi:hypothetical protein
MLDAMLDLLGGLLLLGQAVCFLLSGGADADAADRPVTGMDGR